MAFFPPPSSLFQPPFYQVYQDDEMVFTVRVCSCNKSDMLNRTRELIALLALACLYIRWSAKRTVDYLGA